MPRMRKCQETLYLTKPSSIIGDMDNNSDNKCYSDDCDNEQVEGTLGYCLDCCYKAVD